MVKKLFSKLIPLKYKKSIIYTQIAHYFAKKSAITSNTKYISQLIDSRKPIYLELGAGPKKGENGWVTSDNCKGADLWLDLLEPFPFSDNSIDKIYSSHVFEHFYTTQIEKILGECYRVLKPGGTISISVPNAEIYINAYLKPEKFDPEMFCRYKPGYRFYSKIDYINYMAHMEGHHSHLFDIENLLEMLNLNGFKEVSPRSFDPVLDLKERDYESIYAQGVK